MVPGYLWARQVLRRLRVWGPCCRQPASSRRSSGFWPPMWWRPEPCTSTNSGTLTGSCCLRGGRYGTWSSGGCFGAWVSPRAFMRCSVGCTWACALRRKMYDPQRVEGTPPSGLRLGVKLLLFFVAFCVQVPGAHFAIMRREACQRECPRAGCLAEYMASRSSFRGGCLAKAFASRRAFVCL